MTLLLLQLPQEILSLIWQQCSLSVLCRLATTCKTCRSLIRQPGLGRLVLKRESPSLMIRCTLRIPISQMDIIYFALGAQDEERGVEECLVVHIVPSTRTAHLFRLYCGLAGDVTWSTETIPMSSSTLVPDEGSEEGSEGVGGADVESILTRSPCPLIARILSTGNSPPSSTSPPLSNRVDGGVSTTPPLFSHNGVPVPPDHQSTCDHCRATQARRILYVIDKEYRVFFQTWSDGVLAYSSVGQCLFIKVEHYVPQQRWIMTPEGVPMQRRKQRVVIETFKNAVLVQEYVVLATRRFFGLVGSSEEKIELNHPSSVGGDSAQNAGDPISPAQIYNPWA